MLEDLKKKAGSFPSLPGVYLLKDESGRILYVGKAISLRKRVRSYLAGGESLSPRLKSLQAHLADIDYIVTDNEVEALILECNLIKEYRPRFNVNLKDDKDYPYLILTAEYYPRIELLRMSQKNGRRGRYRAKEGKEEYRFGPYTNVGSVRETIRLLSSIFPLRRCRKELNGTALSDRPCLNYQMGRCLAPCRGEIEVSCEYYDSLVRQVALFLQGRYGDLEKKLMTRMKEAADDQNFEEAVILRDRIAALQKVAGQQQEVLNTAKQNDQDVIVLGRLGRKVAAHLFQVREGKLIRQDHFLLSSIHEAEDEEIIASFIKSYYSRTVSLPPEIVVSSRPAEEVLLKRWLALKGKRKISLHLPRRGSEQKLVKLAGRNCLLRLEEEEELKKRRVEEPLQELVQLLGIEGTPIRIEAYDISHLQGRETVGAMVVFQEGVPEKESYRLFNIRHAPSGDDYASLQELLQRRIEKDNWPKPNLILIDGGKGQLNAVSEVLKNSELGGVAVAALAKNPDHLFIEGSPLPVILKTDSPLLQLLQRIRNEVHRFALQSHRRKRERVGTESLLEEIPGIGPSRRIMLLRHFGSIAKIREASIEELVQVPGITVDLAGVINRHLCSGKS